MSLSPLTYWKPKTILADYIDCYWRLKGYLGLPGVRLIPHYYTEVIINLGNPHILIEANNRHLKYFWVNGPKQTPVSIFNLMHSHFIAIRFKPAGLNMFFSYPAADFLDKIIDCDLVFGSKINSLRESLGEANTDEEILQRLNQFFISKLKDLSKTKTKSIEIISDSLSELSQNLNINLQELANDYGLSYRQFLRYFQETVGVSPKMIQRLEKFQRSAISLTEANYKKMVEVANENEYFDQAHFSKSFKEFTNLTPMEYFSLLKKNNPVPVGKFPLIIPLQN